MSTFKIEINVDGFNEVRKSPEIQDDLHVRGSRVAQAAGGSPDFEVLDAPSSTRARVIVRTATTHGRILEAADRALSRGFDAARG